MARLALTERFIRSPARITEAKAANGGRRDYHDSIVPGVVIRVFATGHRSFNLIARFPSRPQHPARRALGDCYLPPDGGEIIAAGHPVTHGALTLAEAREKARRWLSLIGRGIDPKTQEARDRAAVQREQGNTFGRVAEEFLSRHAAKLAHAGKARRIVDAEFVKRWAHRPITDIQPDEAAAAIRAIVKRGTPAQARLAFEWLRLLYSWSIGTGEFGVTVSPVANLRPTALIGRKTVRNRILKDAELRAVWEACAGPLGVDALIAARSRAQKRAQASLTGYPYAGVFRLMILTGQREREIAEARWSEIDLDNATWTLPAARMKSDRAHLVPLAPDAMALLRSLPRFSRGDHVFTTMDGVKPVNGFSKAKMRLDALSGVKDWVLHDLRRTVRTHFSALPVQDVVREAVIAHARPGLHRVYDLHSYADEKRHCLELWEHRLRGILAPEPPAEVADIEAERSLRLA
jgi:integrase